MCVVKTPKISPEAGKEKPVQVFTNRYFTDRGADAVAARAGRNALRIDLGSSPTPATNPAPPQSLTPGVQYDAATGQQAPTIKRAGGLRNGLVANNLAIN